MLKILLPILIFGISSISLITHAEENAAFADLTKKFNRAKDIRPTSIPKMEGYYIGKCFLPNDSIINDSILSLNSYRGQSLGPDYPRRPTTYSGMKFYFDYLILPNYLKTTDLSELTASDANSVEIAVGQNRLGHQNEIEDIGRTRWFTTEYFDDIDNPWTGLNSGRSVSQSSLYENNLRRLGSTLILQKRLFGFPDSVGPSEMCYFYKRLK